MLKIFTYPKYRIVEETDQYGNKRFSPQTKIVFLGNWWTLGIWNGFNRKIISILGDDTFDDKNAALEFIEEYKLQLQEEEKKELEREKLPVFVKTKTYKV